MQSLLKAALKGISWLFIVAGGLVFWAGGRAIHEVFHVDRILAEVEGLAVAAVVLLAGASLRYAADRAPKHPLPLPPE